MDPFRDNINLEPLAIFVVEDIRVDSCCYCKWVMEWRTLCNGEDLCIGTRKKGHDLCKQSAER